MANFTTTVYTDEAKAYIKSNYKRGMTLEALQPIADYIGAGVTGLRKKIIEMGLCKQSKPKAGDERIRSRFGAKFRCILQDDGKWKPIEQLTPYNMAVREKERERNRVREFRRKQALRENREPKPRAPKQPKAKKHVLLVTPPKQMKQREVDETTLKWVVVDSKTTIRVSKEISNADAIAAYHKKRLEQVKNR